MCEKVRLEGGKTETDGKRREREKGEGSWGGVNNLPIYKNYCEVGPKEFFPKIRYFQLNFICVFRRLLLSFIIKREREKETTSVRVRWRHEHTDTLKRRRWEM